MKSAALFFGLFLLSPFVLAQKVKTASVPSNEEPTMLGSLISSKPRYTREMVLGNILKGALENMHLSNKQIDNSLSDNAFKSFL